MDEAKKPLTQSAKLRALYDAVPHVSLKYQKKLAIAAKLLEINEICKHYDKMTPTQAKSQGASRRQQLINAVLPHVSEQKRQSLATLAQAMEMQDIITNFENFKEMS